MIDLVNTLQFIDSMTGRLAWPVAAVILGLIFRRSLVGLLERVRKLRWGDREAELAEATKKAEEVVEKRARPLLEKADDPEQVERLVQDAARWGLLSALSTRLNSPVSTVFLSQGSGKTESLASVFARMRDEGFSTLPKLHFPLNDDEGRDDDDPDDDPPRVGAPA